MTWTKLGLIFQPDSSVSWMRSHAQLPTPWQIEGTLFKIFFASRDINQKSHVGYILIDLEDPQKILEIGNQPVLAPGPIGHFDQDGIFPSCIIKNEDQICLYYIGWTQGSTYPLFQSAIGMATSKDGGKTFEKYSSAPILDRSPYDPCLVTSPFIFAHQNQFEMLYVSGFKWDKHENNLRSYYHIKRATSQNGISWNREGDVAIDFADSSERNIARTCVYKNNDFFEAWYCYHRDNQPYRIGYAESHDGKKWMRKDECVNIHPTHQGFDSEMMCYPYVFSANGNKYMLYNGNRYGMQGFGLAKYNKG